MNQQTHYPSLDDERQALRERIFAFGELDPNSPDLVEKAKALKAWNQDLSRRYEAEVAGKLDRIVALLDLFDEPERSKQLEALFEQHPELRARHAGANIRQSVASA